MGVTRRAYVALRPCATVVVALEAPLTVNRMPPPVLGVPAMPVPVSGTGSGDAGSVLRMVSVPVALPVFVGRYVTLTEQD